MQESADSDHRFIVVFKDLYILKQWDIHQPVVINDDVAYMRYLIGNMPIPMKNYLTAFANLFLRAVEHDEGKTDVDER